MTFSQKKIKAKRKLKRPSLPLVTYWQNKVRSRKKTVKKKKEKEKSNQSGSTKTVKKEEDDEWVDYEEEAEKDFSDLKIQKLQISKDDDFDRLGEGTESDNEGPEGRERREAASGPWNKTTVTSSVAETAETEPAPAVEKEPPPPKETPKPTGKYIPPAVRRAMDAGGLSGVKVGSSRRKKQAPNVMSEEDFPSLGGSHTESSTDNSSTLAAPPGKFEQVRGGGRQVDDPQGQSQRLEIGNKFDALSSADS